MNKQLYQFEKFICIFKIVYENTQRIHSKKNCKNDKILSLKKINTKINSP